VRVERRMGWRAGLLGVGLVIAASAAVTVVALVAAVLVSVLAG
jgi:hypothetical protein